MGKIRVKTLGVDEIEEQEKNEAKKRQEHKKTAKVPGMKGGERVASVGPSEEEIEKLVELEAEKKEEETEVKEEKKTKKAKFAKTKKAPHSQSYQKLFQVIDRSKTYTLKEGLELLEKLQRGKFDETVELHINTLTTGITGHVTLPHGTGKKTKVVVADDNLIAEIEKGKINFDILIATPQIMPKLARVAKILGPKGLMPNPKNGTITDKPEEVIKKYEGGQISFKTETKTPIIHATVGKVSFGEKKLSENIESMIKAIKKTNIRSVILKSTMSPGIRLQI